MKSHYSLHIQNTVQIVPAHDFSADDRDSIKISCSSNFSGPVSTSPLSECLIRMPFHINDHHGSVAIIVLFSRYLQAVFNS